MKKAIFSLMAVCGFMGYSTAQYTSHKQGNTLFNAGVGI